MGALAADRKIERRTSGTVPAPVKASAKIYGGSLTMHAGTGYIIPGADTTGCIFRGVADDRADNSSGLDGAITAEVWQEGIFFFEGDANATFAVTDIGIEVTILDDHTVSKIATTTYDVKCGILVEFVSATKVGIRIDGYAK